MGIGVAVATAEEVAAPAPEPGETDLFAASGTPFTESYRSM